MKKGAGVFILLVLLVNLAAAADTPGTTIPSWIMSNRTDTTEQILIHEGYPPTLEQKIYRAPGMDEYRFGSQDFCWTHTFTAGYVPHSVRVQLYISHWDVDRLTTPVDPELDKVYVDGVYVGTLQGSDGLETHTMLEIPPQLMDDGRAEICVDIDSTHNTTYWAVAILDSTLYTKYDQTTIKVPEPLSGLIAALLISPALAYLLQRKNSK